MHECDFFNLTLHRSLVASSIFPKVLRYCKMVPLNLCIYSKYTLLEFYRWILAAENFRSFCILQKEHLVNNGQSCDKTFGYSTSSILRIYYGVHQKIKNFLWKSIRSIKKVLSCCQTSGANNYRSLYLIKVLGCSF